MWIKPNFITVTCKRSTSYFSMEKCSTKASTAAKYCRIFLSCSLKMCYIPSTTHTDYGEYLIRLLSECPSIPYPNSVYHMYGGGVCVCVCIFICASTFYMFFSHLICSSPDVKYYVRNYFNWSVLSVPIYMNDRKHYTWREHCFLEMRISSQFMLCIIKIYCVDLGCEIQCCHITYLQK